MKVYTNVDYVWDDNKGKLVEVSSESFEYGGEVSLAVTRVGETKYSRRKGYSYEENLKDEYVGEDGTVYRIYERRWRRNRNTGKKTRGYLVIATDKDGNFIREKSQEANNKSDARIAAKSYAGDIVYTRAEYQNKILADREARRLDLKASEAVAQAKQSAMDTTAMQTELAQRQVSRASGEAIRQQRDALLAQGYNPEEARMMTAQGSENIARTVADVGMQGQAIQAQTVGQLASFGAEQGWTAESLSQGIRQMQQDLMKHRENLANQLQVAKIGRDTARYQMYGGLAQGIGEAVGGSTFNFGTGGTATQQSRLGGEIRRLGGEIEGE